MALQWLALLPHREKGPRGRAASPGRAAACGDGGGGRGEAPDQSPRARNDTSEATGVLCGSVSKLVAIASTKYSSVAALPQSPADTAAVVGGRDRDACELNNKSSILHT
ncbi:unnamed protein product [Pleuronectes platessa]|uniref:Uncharacterized protein n=1 Tax=Pleuronectes platessa TaxID=8262 RepID=A0A9N7VQP7_PLEPL|nr:unnamed protein product [Pleuronectes platessa]